MKYITLAYKIRLYSVFNSKRIFNSTHFIISICQILHKSKSYQTKSFSAVLDLHLTI